MPSQQELESEPDPEVLRRGMLLEAGEGRALIVLIALRRGSISSGLAEAWIFHRSIQSLLLIPVHTLVLCVGSDG